MILSSTMFRPKNTIIKPLSFAKCLHLSISYLFFSILCCEATADQELLGLAPVTHGVAVGAVGDGSALIWSRTDRDAIMHVRIESEDGHPLFEKTAPVVKERDFTGKIKVIGLKPDTVYHYQVWFDAENGKPSGKFPASQGKFRTAPLPTAAKAVTFAWTGDLAGQNVCRDAEEGFPGFNAINALDIDFFVGLGDMIYADNICEEIGKYGNRQVPGNFQPAANMKDYWEHWKYNREDTAYQQLLAKTPYFVVWDDHEVVNDFGPLKDTRDHPPYDPGEHLLPLGRRAYEDYNPIEENPDSPHRLYYASQWGSNIEVIFMDNRQYRDANISEDDPARQKTMLGREQVVWLKEKLRTSKALWKVIVSSVPMSIPTGWPATDGRDGWANFDMETGYENELLDIISYMKGLENRNYVWITTDVHFAEVFRYTPFPEDPSFNLHEFVVGPISAGLFPSRDYDATLNPEVLFFHGPETMDSVKTWEEAKKWFNFGVISVDKSGKFTGSVRDTFGTILYETTLLPER